MQGSARKDVVFGQRGCILSPYQGQNGNPGILSPYQGQNGNPGLDNYKGLTARWSPDGRSLLAAGGIEKDRDGLYRIDPATGKTERILRVGEGRIWDGVWSADGKSVFYVKGPHAEREIDPAAWWRAATDRSGRPLTWR